MQNNGTNNNLAQNTNDDEISQSIPQRNNGEEIKENSRVEQIASTIRDSYKANAKELKGLLNKNGSVNYDELNTITRKVLSGDATIQSPFFGEKTTKNPESRRIIEATIVGQAVRQSDSGNVRGSRSEESEQAKKQELALVKYAKDNNLCYNDVLSYRRLMPV